jgi:hypothetical protein
MPGVLLDFVYAILAANSASGGAAVAVLLVFLPVMFGMVVTSGDRMAVLYGGLIWLVVLLSGAWIASDGHLGNMLLGSMIFGMVYSVIAVPIFALSVKLLQWVLRTRNLA